MEFGGLLDGLTIPPLVLLIGGVALGMFLAARFPQFVPSFFKPAPTQDDLAKLVEEAVKKALAK